MGLEDHGPLDTWSTITYTTSFIFLVCGTKHPRFVRFDRFFDVLINLAKYFRMYFVSYTIQS